MYLGIVGAGAIGAPLARKFSRMGERLLVIDAKEARCKEIAESADAEIFVGDARDPALLEKAGIQKVDALLVLTDDDAANVTICEAAKTRFGIPRVITLANSPSQKTRLKEAGADRVVCPEEETLALFERSIFRRSPDTVFKDSASNLSVLALTIGPESKALGQTIAQLHLPRQCRAFMLVRDNAPLYLEGRGKKRAIQLGDEVFLVGPSDQVDAAELLFR